MTFLLCRVVFHLATKPTIHIATPTIIIPNTALRPITIPRLARVQKPQRLRVDASDLDLKHVRQLAVDAVEVATGSAELRHAADDVLEGVLEGHVEAVLGVAAAGDGGSFVFLVLHDVHAAVAAGVALGQRVGVTGGGLGTSGGAEGEGGEGEEGGDFVVHFYGL